MKIAVRNGRAYFVVNPVESIRTSGLISNVLARGDLFGVDIITGDLTIIKGEPKSVTAEISFSGAKVNAPRFHSEPLDTIDSSTIAAINRYIDLSSKYQTVFCVRLSNGRAFTATRQGDCEHFKLVCKSVISNAVKEMV